MQLSLKELLWHVFEVTFHQSLLRTAKRTQTPLFFITRLCFISTVVPFCVVQWKPTFNPWMLMGIFLLGSETRKRSLIVYLACGMLFMTFLPSFHNGKFSSQLESSCRSSNELVTITRHSKHVEALPVVWNSYHLPSVPGGLSTPDITHYLF